MTMLRAPKSPPEPARPPRSPITLEEATLRDVPRIAYGHTAAIARREPRIMRWLIWPSLLATALRLIGQIGRAEVFTTGHGSSVVVTPTTRTRTPMAATVVATITYLLLVIAIPLAITAGSITIGGLPGTLGVLTVAAYLLAIAGSPLAAAHIGRGRPNIDSAERALLRSGAAAVRLHDLVRHPHDPAGTGVALLHAVIRDPRFGAATIVATAATGRLAAAYEAAGMTQTPGTLTLTRPPQTQLICSAA